MINYKIIKAIKLLNELPDQVTKFEIYMLSLAIQIPW